MAATSSAPREKHSLESDPSMPWMKRHIEALEGAKEARKRAAETVDMLRAHPPVGAPADPSIPDNLVQRLNRIYVSTMLQGRLQISASLSTPVADIDIVRLMAVIDVLLARLAIITDYVRFAARDLDDKLDACDHARDSLKRYCTQAP